MADLVPQNIVYTIDHKAKQNKNVDISYTLQNNN